MFSESPNSLFSLSLDPKLLCISHGSSQDPRNLPISSCVYQGSLFDIPPQIFINLLSQISLYLQWISNPRSSCISSRFPRIPPRSFCIFPGTSCISHRCFYICHKSSCSFSGSPNSISLQIPLNRIFHSRSSVSSLDFLAFSFNHSILSPSVFLYLPRISPGYPITDLPESPCISRR
jgi:hypothetical protein